jgi:hypothetical protein
VGRDPDGGEFESEGYFRVMGDQCRMEWGANVYRDYSGWLQVEPSGDSASEVTVHLSFGDASVEGQIQEQSSDERARSKKGWRRPWSPSGGRSRRVPGRWTNPLLLADRF